MKFPEVLSFQSPPIVFSYSSKDTILYALSVGMGSDPMNTIELPFVYEKNLRAVPTMAVTLFGGGRSFLSDAGVNRQLMVQGEQRLRIHAPMPPEARIETTSRCLSVIDKGKDKGALLNIEHSIADAEHKHLYATHILTLFCRGDGGFGGPSEGALPVHDIPRRPHDRQIALATRPDQAIIYRLSCGDQNPLHIDPDVARQAGFARPPLHGQCTYGVACRAVMQAYCDFDPNRIRTFDARFSSPIFPGETLVTKLWKDGSVVSFECSAAERAVTVLRNGRCELTE